MTPNPKVRRMLRSLVAKKGRLGVAGVALTLSAAIVAGGAAAGVWAGRGDATTPAGTKLAAMLPRGALLTIEEKDFAGLLKHWSDSPEKAAWLKSDNFSVFSRSRLFGRLGDAQNEFAAAAGLPPDMSFLDEVAGRESVFAWYDIGKLEFLYITHMSPGSADKTRLAQMRGKFETRQAGGESFYVRTQSDENQGGQPRTVAFATSGDWLLLATREDLMAGALSLLATNASGDAPANSLASEPWFADARAAAGKDAGDLRMTLNLEKIVPSPYFRSYWVQRNITEMKQYRSAVADLSTEANDFREERVLLPKSAPERAGASPDLEALVAILPQHSGVFRAVAAPTAEAAVASLNEKLIERGTGNFADARIAPEADVSVTEAGSAADLETRIDAAPLAHPPAGAEVALLRQTLAQSDLQAMLTVSRTNEARDGIWVPFESAVVFESARGWDAAAMQTALQEAVQSHLTAGGLGLAWKEVRMEGMAGSGSYFELSDARPLEMAVRGNRCILTDAP